MGLSREVGLPGAVMMGLGSIVGTGVFVSLGLSAGLVGSWMPLTLLVACGLAVCNGMSTAQLAADHPVSGGAYEYGYRYVGSWVGYFAGWMFMAAKSASAATAAIGFGSYFNHHFNIQAISEWQTGLIVACVMVAIAAYGIKQSNIVNTLIVSVTILALSIFIVTVGTDFEWQNFQNAQTSSPDFSLSFFEASALMFVAYTGYGRVATLGAEIKDPKRNIPKAVMATLAVSFLLYFGTALIALGGVGPEVYYDLTVNGASPLQAIADKLGHPVAATLLSFGAMTAMLGVLLNLILGLSRVVFAMGKRGDVPEVFSTTDAKRHSPVYAVLLSGLVIVSLVFLKDIRATWSFSAVTVLLYYSVTNLSALRLPEEKRLYPRVMVWMGLLGCLSLSFWMDKSALQLCAYVLVAGVIWRLVYRKFASNS